MKPSKAQNLITLKDGWQVTPLGKAGDFQPLTDVAPIQELQRALLADSYAQADLLTRNVDLVCEKCDRVTHTLRFTTSHSDDAEPLFYPSVWLDGNQPIARGFFGNYHYQQADGVARPVPGRAWFALDEDRNEAVFWQGVEPATIPADPNLVRDAHQRGTLRGKYQLACLACDGGQVKAPQEVFEQFAKSLYRKIIEAAPVDRFTSEGAPLFRPSVSLQYLAENLEKAAQRLTRFAQN